MSCCDSAASPSPLRIEGTATVALAGNPNVGKSTLFNALTGLHQHVGNWSGKTVERKEGTCSIGDLTIRLVDLPGTHSLSALSPEELVAREFIALESPDVVISVVDASNLERNLYLTLQLLELTDRVIVALNMIDLAERKGLVIDVRELERRLGVPVVPLVAERRDGPADVLAAIGRVLQRGELAAPPRAGLPVAVAEAVGRIASTLPERPAGFDSAWFARKLLEGDSAILEVAGRTPALGAAHDLARELRADPHLADAEAEVISAQYELLSTLLDGVVRKGTGRLDWSDALDRVVLHRYWGYPILIGVFALMFWATFSLGAGTPISNALTRLLDEVGGGLQLALVRAGAPDLLVNFIVAGLWAGFETVVGFFPLIAVFFTAFALLEDSGYLARAAYLVDRFMSAIGLHGRSFLPLLMGFGCNVPAVMSARGIDNPGDRLLTILVNPLMLCQARLVVFVFFAATFFSGWRAAVVMLSLYGLSALLVVLMSALLKRTLFQSEPAPFLLELPPYHLPVWRNVATHAWRSTRMFIRRAGGQITVMTAAIWLFTHLPLGPVDESFAGRLGHLLAPLGRSMGLDWRLLVSLIAGFLAKEGVLASLAVLYGVGPHGLAGALRHAVSPLAAYAFMVVSLVYIPCFSTLVVIRRETLSWRWTAFASLYGLVLAFVLGTGIFQIGRLLGLG